MRGVASEFAPTAKVTGLSPTPAAPAVTVTHETLLTAVHAQPAPAWTATVPAPPTAEHVLDEGAE